ncbi:2'-5' RNA ligase family protein [Winogradskyella sp. A3E31]|uniref:2'-5' RNA ligase family protein n=1 Tax=Winogradskyella sp. A3E31 TaxID=3349637 RepID=UPI00398B3CE2
MDILRFDSKLNGHTVSFGVREYLFIHSPSISISNDVQRFKKDLSNRYGEFRYGNSKAHISLNHFLTLTTPERTIKKELYLSFHQWKSFNVNILNFGMFPNSRTIFLNTSSHEILKLQNYLRTILRQRVKVPKKFTQPLSKPHITIASDISKNIFDECWNYFSNKTYEEQFVANRITALCRNLSLEETKFRKVFEIEFN